MSRVIFLTAAWVGGARSIQRWICYMAREVTTAPRNVTYDIFHGITPAHKAQCRLTCKSSWQAGETCLSNSPENTQR